jgi:hypothetical protein
MTRPESRLGGRLTQLLRLRIMPCVALGTKRRPFVGATLLLSHTNNWKTPIEPLTADTDQIDTLRKTGRVHRVPEVTRSNARRARVDDGAAAVDQRDRQLHGVIEVELDRELAGEGVRVCEKCSLAGGSIVG